MAKFKNFCTLVQSHLKFSIILNLFQIRLWSLPRRECLRTLTAHTGFVRGLCVSPSGDSFISVSSFCYCCKGCLHCSALHSCLLAYGRDIEDFLAFPAKLWYLFLMYISCLKPLMTTLISFVFKLHRCCYSITGWWW